MKRRFALGLAVGIAITAGVLAVAFGGWWRHAPEGAPERNFGATGTLVTPLSDIYGPTDAWASVVSIAPDGTISAAGGFEGPTGPGFSLTHYTASGRLDYTFENVNYWEGPARAVASQPDGKVVVALTSPYYGGPAGFWLARHTTSGKLDPSFGKRGEVWTSFSSAFVGATAVAIEPDGKIVVAGYAGRDVALARYTTSGKLDTSFGRGGKVRTSFGPWSHATAVAIEPDGKIVVAGTTGRRDHTYDWALARYTTSGTLDRSFGTRGKVLAFHTAAAQHAVEAAIQPDGKIVVAGGSSIDGFALARFTTNGTLDTSFGTDGRVLTHFSNVRGATSVGIEPNGTIVVAGPAPSGRECKQLFLYEWQRGQHTQSCPWAFARYTTTGTLDTSFGTGGKVVTPLGVANGTGAVAVAPDGKIVLAGIDAHPPKKAPARS